MPSPTYILTLSCKDVMGIVSAVSTFLMENGGFILESAQFGDASTGRFFMRCEFETHSKTLPKDELEKKFDDLIARRFNMDWHLYDKAHKSRVLVMVSHYGHCLNDILHRYHAGTLAVEIPSIVSNHEDFRKLSEWHGIPYHYLPVTKENKIAQEAAVLKLVQEQKIDLVVLARYMQILSPELSQALKGMAINIHHSFLPSFKGAKPYHQAFQRGVKIIGATAHYVTDDLDEGPIIEQQVERVDHTHKPEDLLAIGRDIECVVLSRAVRYHTEHRVLLNDNKTVVFK